MSSQHKSYLWISATVLVTLAAPSTLQAGIGFEAMAQPGYGSAGSQSPVLYQPSGVARMPDDQVGSIWNGKVSPYKAGLVLDGALGLRPLPFLSTGLAGGWRKFGAESGTLDDSSSNLARTGLRVGFYGRFYLPLVGALTGLEPWAGVGVGYVYDKQTFDRQLSAQGTTVPVTYDISHHGIGVPVSVGVNYHVLPLLSVGPVFQYEHVFGVAGCVSFSSPSAIGNSYCSTADSKVRLPEAKAYGVWSLGLEIHLSL